VVHEGVPGPIPHREAIAPVVEEVEAAEVVPAVVSCAVVGEIDEATGEPLAVEGEVLQGEVAGRGVGVGD
jgi:hypothetical protein